METKCYYVIEMQSNDTGAGIITCFSNIEDARSKYFDVLRVACKKGSIRKHGAILLDENAFPVEPGKVFDFTEQ